MILRAMGLIGLGLFVGAAFTPLPNVLSRWFGAPERLERAEAIVVLSGGIRSGGILTANSLRRALHGIELYRKGLAPLLLFLGTASTAPSSEARAREELARAYGVPRQALLAAQEAWTTREEAAEVKALLQSKGIRRILLVTNPEHMARARWLFERAGFEVSPAPADEFPSGATTPQERLLLTRRILEESVALLYYRFAGYL